MLRQIFKMIWKRKQSNLLTMLEIFISFLILFALWSLSLYYLNIFSKAKSVDTDGVLVLYLNYNADSLPNTEQIARQLKSYNEVAYFAFTSMNIPYGGSISNNDVGYQDNYLLAEEIKAGFEWPSVLGIKILKGRAISSQDTIRNIPVLINEQLSQSLFGQHDPLGKRIMLGRGESPEQGEVIGVFESFKLRNDYHFSEYCLIRPVDLAIEKNCLIIKLNKSAQPGFEDQLVKGISAIGSNWFVELKYLSDMQSDENRKVWLPVLILAIVCCFLLFNVVLGIFGVLFQNISRRKEEIGIRRAFGARKSDIFRQFIFEMLALASIGILIGLFFAIQFPILGIFDVQPGIYVTAILWAIFSIYVLVVICALIPSWRASHLLPVNALHDL
ncbi:MAG TPA: FtsX-like permease family protein [Saprospiraceae bacterium]|nr:FtsX-like permease family protein [Saprospiraceae bacterium]HMQ82306.1 FtsX-like permease family protein [Saprospiraceae bacterium]